MTSVKHVHKKYVSKPTTSSDWKNIYVVSVFAFVDALQFAFFVWTFWPYCQQLDPTLSASFIGLIMAVSGLGEAVAAPIFGYWTNCTGLIVPPLIASIVMSIVGNVIYMCLNEVPLGLRTYGLLLSRFLNGAGSGNRGTYFAYIAAASDTSDRARSMALSGGGALIGLNVGPAAQMLFTWIGGEGVDVGFMRISMYTAPAILAIVINISCIIFLVFCLEDGLDRYNAPDSDNVSTYSIAAASDSDLERNAVKTVRMDVLAVVVCMWTRAARMLITANVESIGSPFSEVMFGLDNEQVLNYNAMMQGAVGVLTTVMFIVYAFTDYSKWVSERLNCLGAMIALLAFHLLTFSWPFLTGDMPGCDKYVAGNGTTHGWDWCESLRPINFWVYYIGYAVIFGIGLPCLNNSLQSLYSQILGKGRQGTMQGINQAAGCVSRILGPLLMSTTFASFGPRATWLIEIGLISICLFIWCTVYRRLKPAGMVEIKERTITLDQGDRKVSRSDSVSTNISVISDPTKVVSTP
nr:Major facilitator superfamily MFS-1 domain containing protein [Haemonchus contortus]